MTLPLSADQVSDFARKNAIINGDMRIWQRGTAFSQPGSGNRFTADRLHYIQSNDGTMVIDRSTDVPNDQFLYSTKFSPSVADTSIASNQYAAVKQSIEGYNFRRFKGETATLGFWAKSNKAGTLCVAFRSYAATVVTYPIEVSIAGDSAWHFYSVTLPFDYTSGGWGTYTNDGACDVWFTFAAGWFATAEEWSTSTAIATSNIWNFMDDTANEMYITGVQLELGSGASDFEFLSQQQQLAMCQRYYWRHTAGDTYSSFVNGMINDATTFFGTVSYPVTMRAAPTFTWSGSLRVVRGGLAVSAVAANYADTATAYLQATVSGATIGDGAFLQANNDATAYVAFDAEL